MKLTENGVKDLKDAQNDEVVMRFLLGLGSAGNVRTTTVKAFTKEQYAEIIKQVP